MLGRGVGLDQTLCVCVCVCVKGEYFRSGLQSEGNKFSVWFRNRGMRRGYSMGVEEQVFKTIEKKEKKRNCTLIIPLSDWTIIDLLPC